jgi:hypothetical protein
MADEEVREGIAAVFPRAEGAAMDIDDEGDSCGASVWREIEKTFDREAAGFPADELGSTGPSSGVGRAVRGSPSFAA